MELVAPGPKPEWDNLKSTEYGMTKLRTEIDDPHREFDVHVVHVDRVNNLTELCVFDAML